MDQEIDSPDSLALVGLRRRGQFLISSVLWAAFAGSLLALSAYLVVLYHYGLGIADRLRSGLGLHPPETGPDFFLLAVLAAFPILFVLGAIVFSLWYRHFWSQKLALVWPNPSDRRHHARWRPLPLQANPTVRAERAAYLSKLRGVPISLSEYEIHAEDALALLEKEVAERALATGLIVGISRNSYVDLFTIFAATLELQLHVLSSLGKRPSWRTWRLLAQRCGASLFFNSYLNRQDALTLNLLIKKAGMGLHAAGDLIGTGMTHLSESDIDFDEALGLQHAGLVGLATRSIEMGATMAFTVGQVGLYTLGALVESVGDELAQGALAAAIIYYHGMTLAADTLALDRQHRRAPAMNRDFRNAVWKMGEVAGDILLEFIRLRRTAFRERRQRVIRSIPKTAYEKIQSLFGRKAPVEE